MSDPWKGDVGLIEVAAPLAPGSARCLSLHSCEPLSTPKLPTATGSFTAVLS